MHLSCFLPVVLLASLVDAAPYEGVKNTFQRRGGHDAWKATHGGAVARRAKGGDMPVIGSPEWKALYPPIDVVPTDMPQEWLDALRSVEARGLIPSPDINPVATVWPDGSRSYGGKSPTDPTICNNGMGCGSPLDVSVAPEGMLGVSQDDGPLGPGVRLYEFFEQNNISSTHFYTGSNIIRNFGVFLQCRSIPGQHFAVHSWSHPYTTGLTNEQVVAEIGWTMQIIADNNFGLIPAHWRPPYGDVDNRVRAIALHVFGLKTLTWFPDPQDYFIHTGQKSKSAVIAEYSASIKGPKSPGLIPLEHVLSVEAVDVFLELYPLMQEEGWNVTNIPNLWPGEQWYKNSLHTDSTPPPGSPLIPGIGIVSPRYRTASPNTAAQGEFAPEWHEDYHKLDGRPISGKSGRGGAAGGGNERWKGAGWVAVVLGTVWAWRKGGKRWGAVVGGVGVGGMMLC